MKNIDFKITREDIQEYMKNHQQLVYNKEALFVKYMKENKNFSAESIEILNQKYCLGIPPIWNEAKEKNPALSVVLKQNFQNYLESQKENFEINCVGLYNIMIASLGFYQKNQTFEHTKTYFEACDIGELLEMSYVSFLDSNHVILKDAVENHIVARQIEDFGSMYTGYYTIIIPRLKCRNILLEYENIYGKEIVRKIRKLVRERERMK